MAFEQFLNDLCDIYHVQKDTGSPGYGLNKQPTFSYPAEPDVRRRLSFRRQERKHIHQPDRPGQRQGIPHQADPAHRDGRAPER